MRLKWWCLALLLALSAQAQSLKSQEEKESEIINYETIKKVLEEDNLQQVKESRQKLVEKIKAGQKIENISRYNYPGPNDVWTFLSEFWLVKNAQRLGWDFQKPDYGIAPAFKELLEKFGYYNKSFKIMVINSPNVPHMALPANPDETIFIISLPFMRTLDLSKLEIAVLLLEDFFRSELGIFKKKLNFDSTILGQNFHGKDANTQWVQQVLKGYSEIIYEKGFAFQEQFEVTKKMDDVLRSDPSLWNVYHSMLNKISRLVKLNLLYKDYVKIYPSPELQIQWITPKKDVL